MHKQDLLKITCCLIVFLMMIRFTKLEGYVQLMFLRRQVVDFLYEFLSFVSSLVSISPTRFSSSFLLLDFSVMISWLISVAAVMEGMGLGKCV